MNPEGLEEFDIIVVQGIRYRVKKELEIRDHLFAILLSEWEEEEFNREYPEMDRWNWKVETLKVRDIKLWKPLMEDPAFISELEKRVEAQKNMILRGETVEPIVVRGRDMIIYDGYARLHALKQLGKREALAYVGR